MVVRDVQGCFRPHQLSLCRIVVAAITNFRRLIYQTNFKPPFGIDPSEDIQLDWHTGSGFSVNLASPNCRIGFIQEEDEYKEENENATKVLLRRARIQFDDYEILFSDWVSKCREHHGDACNPTILDVPEKFETSVLAGISYAFRLVDVDSLCIIEARNLASDLDKNDERYNYIALSYVWGRVACLQLLIQNQEELMKRRSLKRHWHEIPQTIKDAILLVRKMGFRYLWVDALCLVQDNPLDMLQGINHIDLIYGGAMLTFIAAAGSDANTGLPGVRDSSRRYEQPTEEVKEGVRMTVVDSLDDLLKTSVYSYRAWTYVFRSN